MRETHSGTFGHLLREKRLAVRLSASALASSAGLTQAHLSRIETGERKPPELSACLQLAKKLRIRKGSQEFAQFIRAAHHDSFPGHDAWMRLLGRPQGAHTDRGSEVICDSVHEMVYKANEHVISNQVFEITVRGSGRAVTFLLADPRDKHSIERKSA